ncbi:MAG: hypothetical protein ABI625_23280, partial [bacterium]
DNDEDEEEEERDSADATFEARERYRSMLCAVGKLGADVCREQLFSGPEGLVMTFPRGFWRNSRRRFARAVRMVDFVAFKLCVYGDYDSWLQTEVQRMKESRFSVKERILHDDALRATAYLATIPHHLRTLDRTIRSETPRNRALYSFISDALAFTRAHERLGLSVRDWETEVAAWKNPLVWMSGKFGKSVKDLLKP